MNTRGIAAAGVAAVVLLTGCGSYSPDDYDAYHACQNWVSDRLRAPSTADFSGHNGSKITETSDGYTIDGYVDAQNGFGAQIRTNWTCKVRDTGDNWELVDLTVR